MQAGDCEVWTVCKVGLDGLNVLRNVGGLVSPCIWLRRGDVEVVSGRNEWQYGLL